MPIQKEKKYEITFKNLRHREIPCLVVAVPQKEFGRHSSCVTSNEQKNSRAKILKCLKQRLNRLSKTPTKKSKSLSCLDKKSELLSKVTKKRVYKKRSLQIENSPRKTTTPSEFDTTADSNTNIPVESTEPPKKRTYRRKSLEIENSPQKTTTPSEFDTSAESSTNGPVKSTEPPKKTAYRRKSLEIENSPRKTTTPSEFDTTADSNANIPVESTEPPKKRTYRRKSLEIENSPRKTTTPSEFDTTADFSTNIPVKSTEPPKKRTYRRKFQAGATITPITDQKFQVSKLAVDTFFGAPVITPETPKKRVYLKKLKIPAVPHNTPVTCRGSDGDGDSISNTSFLSHTVGEVITVGKRGRGRPRLSAPVVPLGLDHGDESTTSLESDKGSTTKRARRSLWTAGSDDEGEQEDQVSEYELLRQKNIEENLKKLREIFTEQGLQFEKPSDTPKKRKSYSRLPLPPPRPRSQRIVTRKTFSPLDFSELDEKLSMSEEEFM